MIFGVVSSSPYFAVSDGLFVNYTWKDEELKNSSERGKKLDRLHDIYFGIDVFGRGSFGGGGFNSKVVSKILFVFWNFLY